ncbi:related to cyclin dependent kinase C [Sporisorium reilianum SRZ2]|uniref:Related to cyclin dependent kinase C n=1 Tax=Sporisorium reilianum (strain SRZ2) TaxID=999809 RepID=E6ZQ60_SPORE|nr:related to cyclin dependent kinase C [Sporisorium reilianum SRZ2]
MPPPPPPPPPPSDQGSSSQASAANGGFRIAGVASRPPSASASSSSVGQSPKEQANELPKPATKLDRRMAAAHLLPAKPIPPPPASTASRGTGPHSRDWPQHPSHSRDAHDDEDEEGAINDTGVAKSAPAASPPPKPAFRPPPPKTPPHPSTHAPRPSVSHQSNDRQRHSHYQPRSPSPHRIQRSTSSHAQSSHLRSPSPLASSASRSSRDYDNGAHHRHQQHQRRDHDRYPVLPDGKPAAPSRSQEQRARDSRYPRASSHGRDRDDHDLTRGWHDDCRDDRGWSNDRRAGDRDWGPDHDRRFDRSERDRDRDWHSSRHTDHRAEHPRQRPSDRNGRERELSPPTANKKEQRFAGWSPSPPPNKSDSHSADPASNGNGAEPYATRPPSRMGRPVPPPMLSHSEHPKRPRSRSPPAGLLKRKPNFSAVVPPALAPVSDNVAPGAPLPPKVETMQSPVMPASRLGSESVAATALSGSHPGSALATAPSSALAPTTSTAVTTAAAATVAADANFNAICQALDDFTHPSVRLSCLPRKQPDTPPQSGRERRKARSAPLPLNQRKFVGCSSLDDYEISIKLGQGTFGEVLKGRHILTGTQVALKKVTIHDAKDGLPITALREIKLLKKLKHPSIVPVIDMAFRPSGERGKLGDVYMVEPYMDHDLNGMLENPSIRLEISQIKLYMKQLLEGTLYLHKNRILHRDMKAANLLINNNGQLQIADFGLARPYRDPGQSWTGKGWNGGTQRYTNMVVTRWYRPPELLAGEKKYGPPIDMWGIGCILAEMITGRPLFKGTSELNQLELIAKLCGSPNEATFPGWSSLPGVKDADPMGRPDPHPEVPGQHAFGDYPRKVKDHFTRVVDAGPGCADLIDKLLVLDPRKRLTAHQALEHEWFWIKPFPADPTSLPKYEHSKEIDRARREWKPAPAAAPVAAAAPAAAVMAGMNMAGSSAQTAAAVGGGMGRPLLQQQPYMPAGAAQPPPMGQPQRAYGRPGGGGSYAHPSMQHQPNGGMSMQQSNPADGWDPQHAPPGMRVGPAPAPGGGNRAYPGPGSGGGGTRHPFPSSQGQQGGGRFPHPNAQRVGPHQAHPYPGQQSQSQQQQQQRHGLPSRPNNGGANPYSM